MVHVLTTHRFVDLTGFSHCCFVSVWRFWNQTLKLFKRLRKEPNFSHMIYKKGEKLPGPANMISDMISVPVK